MGLPSPFYGPESHSRDSVESPGCGRCARAFRPDVGYLRTNGEPGQGRPRPAKEPLTRFAVCLIRGEKGEALLLYSVQTGKDCGRPVFQCAVQPPVVVVISPQGQSAARFFERREPFDVKSTLRHSSRNRPLKLSMKPFSTGLPGRKKQSCTPTCIAQASIVRPANSLP